MASFPKTRLFEPRYGVEKRSTPALVNSDRLAQRSERGAELLREQFWLFPRRKVSAFVGFVPIDELVEGLLSPTARSTVDLPGEDRHCDRDLRDLNCVERSAPALRRVPVGPRRGGAGVREPIERDVVEDLISRKRLLNPVVRPLGEFVVEKGEHADRRIRERIAQGLRPGIHHLGIAESFSIKVLEAGERNFFCVGKTRGYRISIADEPQDAWRYGAGHIDVDAQEALRCLDRHDLGYDRAPVATLTNVALVSQALHQLMPCARDMSGTPVGALRLAREAVAGIGRQHEVESVFGLSAVGGRIGERSNGLKKLQGRTGPTVSHDQRHGIRMRRPYVNELKSIVVTN